MPVKPTLHFDQITHTYAGRKLLDDFSMHISGGEWFCLLGKSGVGKSTLARIGAGLLAPDAGRVRRLGGDGIGYLAQSPGDIFIGATIFEEIAFGLSSSDHGYTNVRERVKQSLRLVGLSYLSLETNPTALSGGQQQLLGLAAVLSSQPSFLILDEPTSMLDPQAQLTVLRVLRSVVELGTGILHITHSADEALWAHRVGILHQGKLAGVGRSSEVLSDTSLLDKAGAEQPELLRFRQALTHKGIHLDVPEWSVSGMYDALLAYSSASSFSERV